MSRTICSAQSTQLSHLEAATPAASVDALGTASWTGWSSAWISPASSGQTLGFLGSHEDDALSSVSTNLICLRVRVGPILQLAFGEVTVDNLVDPNLVGQYPELADLRASAILVGADAVEQVGSRTWVSLGPRYEQDDLFGDRLDAWVGRVSVSRLLPMNVSLSSMWERGIGNRDIASPAGRLVIAAHKALNFKNLVIDVGAGGREGDVWLIARRTTATSVAIRLLLANILEGAVSWGQTNGFAGSSSTATRVNAAVGLRLGRLELNIRRGYGAETAAPVAMSVEYTVRQ